MQQSALKKFIQRLFSQSPDDRMKMIVCCLCVLFGLIFLYRGDRIEDGAESQEVQIDGLSHHPFSELETYYEEKVKQALESTDSLTVSHVLINFKSTAGTAYLTDEQIDYNEQHQSSGETIDEHVSHKTSATIVMEETDRDRTPVAYQTNKPPVQGVLIVVDGVADIQVKKQCVEIVSKYLAISPHRVAVQFKGG